MLYKHENGANVVSDDTNHIVLLERNGFKLVEKPKPELKKK